MISKKKKKTSLQKPSWVQGLGYLLGRYDKKP